jgi:hypothetical protein
MVDYSVHPDVLADLLRKNKNKNQYIWWEAPEQLENSDDDIHEYPRDPRNRDASAARGMCQAICLDFDLYDEGKPATHKFCRDSDELDAYLAGAIRDRVIAEPNFIVASGSGGRHLWYTFTSPITCENWTRGVQQLFQALNSRGVPFDPAVGNKPHQLIRAPGSYNCKNKPVLVTIEAHKTTTYSLRRFASAWQIEFDMKSASEIYQQAIEAEQRSKEDLPPISTSMRVESLARGCRYSARAALNREGDGTKHLHYDQWLALCSVIRHIEGGSERLHQASENHPRYDAALTDQKIGPAGVGHNGPASCASLLLDASASTSAVLKVAEEKCAGCSAISLMQKGRATYPLLQIQKYDEALRPREPPKLPLQSAEPESDVPSLSQHKSTQHYELPEIPWGFCTLPAKMPAPKQQWVWMPDPEKPDKKTVVTDTIWAITQTQRDESGTTTYAVSAANGHSTVAAAKCLNDMRSLAEMLSNIGVGIKDRAYTGTLFQQLALKCQNSVDIYNALGWKSKKQFVSYCSVLTSDAEYPAAFAETARDEKFLRDHGQQSGDLFGWRQAAQAALSPGAESMMFALFFALGSVLIEPLRLNNNVAILSLYSPDSGTGKTTCLKLAASLFGTPAASHCGYGDTALSMAHRMGYMRHLPTCIDELTMLDQDVLRNFVYHAVQGMGKRGLTADNKQREVRDWNLSVLTSTNESMWQLLGSKQKAAMDRVFEVHLRTPILGMPEADKMLDGLQEHHGVAGPAFVQAVQALDWKQMRTEYAAINNAIRSRMQYRTDDRFVTHALALATTAARVCSRVPEFNLTPGHVKRLLNWCCEVSNDSSDTRRRISSDAMLQPEDLYRYVLPSLCTLDSRPVVSGNGDVPADAMCWQGDGYFYVRRAVVMAWLNQLRADVRWPSLVSAWEQRGLAKAKTGRIRVTDAIGTRQVSVYRVKLPS